MDYKEIQEICRTYLVEILGSFWQGHLTGKPQAYKEWDFLIFHFSHEEAKKFRGIAKTWSLKKAVKEDFKEFILKYLYDKIGKFDKYDFEGTRCSACEWDKTKYVCRGSADKDNIGKLCRETHQLIKGS